MKFLRFNPRHFILMIIIFIVEVCIAVFVHDNFIRPFVGDIIVVWFMYYFIRAFVECKVLYVAFFTLAFSFFVEIGQYFNLITILGLQESNLARIVMGTSFSWWDLLCYVIGFGFLFIFDKDLRKNH